jgi:WD40 repeat protein
MYWSWTRRPDQKSTSHVHRVFLGHEGSIFGVQISSELDLIPTQGRKRLLASCSDDRTIRVWDISDFQSSEELVAQVEDPKEKRTRHTGFSNASFDADLSSTDCLAIGWGHISRVWTIRFLDHTASSTGVCLLSSGEDATCRTWNLIPNSERGSEVVGIPPYKLLQLSAASSHNGKNMWSLAVHRDTSGLQQATTGGADSKIAAHSLNLPDALMGNGESFASQFTVQDIASSTLATTDTASPSYPTSLHKSSKKAEFFRSYTFIDDNTFLFTTNSGKVYLHSNYTSLHPYKDDATRRSIFVDQFDDLMGYSVCTGIPALGAAFIAGSRGSVYIFQRDTQSLTKIHTFNGKVGELFVVIHGSLIARKLVLLVSLVGQNVAQLLHLDLSEIATPIISTIVAIPLSEKSTGLAITSMDHITTASQDALLILGFRRGSIALYRIPSGEEGGADVIPASLTQAFEKVHEGEAVTSIVWVPTKPTSQVGNVVSTGRDGRLIIHALNLFTNTMELVHGLTLPIGPNIEGIQLTQGHLFVYGFASKRFVLYDTAAEEELMSVDTGGAHRSWTFQPSSQNNGGGTLVWTRASSMHVCLQAGPNHKVLRSGGHGREIKAVAISNSSAKNTRKRLIATGAEDTDIKIFEYTGDEISCRRTLRKHTTGIQHLLWSKDGAYLFSSGGCEEFYIWRVHVLPHELGDIGVVCESVYRPESEHSDLRIMSFDVSKRESGFVVAMVFSNSDVKVIETLDYMCRVLTTSRCIHTTPPLQTSGTRSPKACTLLPALPNASSSRPLPSSRPARMATPSFGPSRHLSRNKTRLCLLPPNL